MYTELTTEVDVTIDTSVSPPLIGKAISKVYEVSFANDKVIVIGRFEGDANKQWSSSFSRDELPTQEAKELYDDVVANINELHLWFRKTDKNYETDKWAEVIEE